jgi:hypothetical protein
LAAAPFGPDTRPRLSASAASMSCRSSAESWSAASDVDSCFVRSRALDSHASSTRKVSRRMISPAAFACPQCGCPYKPIEIDRKGWTWTIASGVILASLVPVLFSLVVLQNRKQEQAGQLLTRRDSLGGQEYLIADRDGKIKRWNRRTYDCALDT